MAHARYLTWLTPGSHKPSALRSNVPNESAEASGRPYASARVPSARNRCTAETLGDEDRHAVFGTGVRARTICMLALLRVRGIHLTRQRQGQVCHFCHKQWITSRHTGTSGE